MGYDDRRSRRTRATLPHARHLTGRDLDYLSVLFENGLTRSHFLHKLVRPNTRHEVTAHALRALWDNPNCLVSRPKQQEDRFNFHSRHTVYDITDDGIRALKDNGRITDESARWRANRKIGRYVDFWHELMIDDVMASIRLEAPDVRYIPYFDILTRAPDDTQRQKNPLKIPVTIRDPFTGKPLKTSLTPDGLFGLAYQQEGREVYRFFVLEADRVNEPVKRSTMNGSSYFKKLVQYHEILSKELYRSHFGIPNLTVLNVTMNQTHMRNIMDALPSAGQGTRWHKRMLFKFMPDDRDAEPKAVNNMLTEPWLRVSHEQLYIDTP